MEELEAALSRLKMRKAGGLSGVFLKLVSSGGPILKDRLLILMQAVGREGKVFNDWKRALIVPVPKKSNLQLRDNWYGISLLDTVGKNLQRLQMIAEGILPDSQCVFQKGRSCIDMTFVAMELMEKTWEHQDSLFLLFVDLSKV